MNAGIATVDGYAPMTPSERKAWSLNRDRAESLLTEHYDLRSVLNEYSPRVSQAELLTILSVYRDALGKPISKAEHGALESADHPEAHLILAIRHFVPDMTAQELRRSVDACRAVGAVPVHRWALLPCRPCVRVGADCSCRAAQLLSPSRLPPIHRLASFTRF
jgi:hypothetical protein